MRVVFFALTFSIQWCRATDTLSVKNFIIKSQIILFNKKPSKSEVFELIEKYNFLKSPANKTLYIESLFSASSFAQSMYDIYMNDFLQGVDDDLITLTVNDYLLLLNMKSHPLFHDIFDSVVQKTLRLKHAPKQLQNCEITISELQRRCMDNKFYDEKNMGADNFVVSTFMYLFSRNPTRYELEESKKMFDHLPGIVFNRVGFSKENYLNILYDSDEYREGQVKYWYQRILNRNPTAEELTEKVYFYKNDLKKIIEEMLCNKEFAGF